LPFSCSQEDDGWHVYVTGLWPRAELEDLTRAMQVVDVLDPIFSSKIAVDGVMTGSEVESRVLRYPMQCGKSW